MKMTVLNLNGRRLAAQMDGDTPLLWALREQFGLTGTKFGCGAGLCCACTVHRDGKVARSCIDPVVDQRTRLLALGSLPGDQSLLRNEYYGNRQNRFWMLMSEVTGLDLVPMAYPSRLQALLANGVGLWDVIAEAAREGGLDNRIRGRADNNLLGGGYPATAIF